MVFISIAMVKSWIILLRFCFLAKVKTVVVLRQKAESDAALHCKVLPQAVADFHKLLHDNSHVSALIVVQKSWVPFHHTKHAVEQVQTGSNLFHELLMIIKRR